MKAAKDSLKVAKYGEHVVQAQAEALKTMAEVTLKKAEMMAEANMLMLITTPDNNSLALEVWQYLCLCREEELAKLEARLTARVVSPPQPTSLQPPRSPLWV